ncbi:MAG: MlaD family protein [Paracoccus sp. (in: a-proteobacteria)]|nr:MlaD family protein [Paracoccus sp. (in: a-proteobacteria)]
METRANFILIGAFTLMAILGTLGFFIWLASVQIDRHYQTYGILFDDVSGLDPSGDVLFNGISVGKVIGLRIYEPDPSKVFATVQIDATTPVRANTVAQLQSQGVTGVAYISLSGGTPDAPTLTAVNDGLPMIRSRRSTVQALVEDAPDLLAQATDLLKQFQSLSSPENQAYVTSILRNLDASSGRLDQALTDFSDISGTVGDATAQISLFTGRLDRIAQTVTTTLASAEKAFDAADRALTSSDTAIQRVGGTFTQAEVILRDTVPHVLDQISATVTRTDAAIADLQNRSGRTLDGFGQTAQLLNTRLTQLEQTLQDANTAFAALGGASDSVGTLVDGDGAALVANARAALARIDATVLTDLPALMKDIRKAVSTASTAITQVAGDVTGLSARFDPLAKGADQTLASANALFRQAQGSLVTLDTALGGAGPTLTSAQTAFDTATAVMQTDLTPVLDDIRTASDRISVAVQDVTRDIPAITADLRALIGRADSVMTQLQAAVAASAPGIGDFARTGLPELTRLGAEARNLVTTLNSLVRRVERDPARFLLDDRVPEYRK